jgi:hypothetical protein
MFFRRVVKIVFLNGSYSGHEVEIRHSDWLFRWSRDEDRYSAWIFRWTRVQLNIDILICFPLGHVDKADFPIGSPLSHVIKIGLPIGCVQIRSLHAAPQHHQSAALFRHRLWLLLNHQASGKIV